MRKHLRQTVTVAGCIAFALSFAVLSGGAQQSPASSPVAPGASIDSGAVGIAPPPDYVIGPEDQLSVVFWHDKDMSADIVVRPDGKISLPLLNEIQASGLTPEQLRQRVSAAAKRFIQDPNATVVVRQINSRKVFITGAVEKPGTFPLNGPTTVLQLIAMAAGVKEYADSKKIVIIRNEAGRQVTFNFNYKEVIAQKNMTQNIDLRPGDTVVVP